jgi:3-deoxy-D-manno-octulosonate 8-phosphate phosphatase (KDO 8-P phosphatase)
MRLGPDELILRASRVRLLLLDVDGVLTPGTVEIASGGGETKSFFIRDGLSLIWARRFGIEVGLLSGRPSEATTRRASELGLSIVVQGTNDKRAGYAAILNDHGYTDDDVAYMGDDLVDLPVLGRAGLATAPADGVDEVRESVHWVSRHAGGRGAVRELVELLLKAQNRWNDLVLSYRVL